MFILSVRHQKWKYDEDGQQSKINLTPPAGSLRLVYKPLQDLHQLLGRLTLLL
jgi:hypothetical protein